MFASLIVLTLAANTTPMQVVKTGNDEVQKLLGQPGLTAQRLAEKADEFIDFVELAKRALGDEWKKLSPKQQTEFANTMKGLLRASYAQKAIADGKRGGKVGWGGEKIVGNEAEVQSTITVGKDSFPVEYKLYKASSKWRIYDVVTDDVSLVATYSDQFQQLISKKGYEGLLSTLKSRRDQLEAQSATTKAEAPTQTAQTQAAQP